MARRKVLIVEDNRMNRTLLRQILCSEYQVIEAEDGDVALSILRKEVEISAVLLDIIMPRMNGFEVLDVMRKDAALSQIPVIVASSNTEEDSEVRALARGAHDYITKPYDPGIIRHRLWNTINLREQAAIVNAIKVDPLTGLYSRMAFFDKVEEYVTKKEPGYYVMTCFDIENFKVVNDQYGSAKGDAILQCVAKIFREGFRVCEGLCCRVMADNFAVLYPTSFMETMEIADIRQKLTQLDGSITPIVYSIGRYIIDDLSLPASAMYDRASIAKTSVKRRYDKHVAMYDESMRKKILEQQRIISEMNGALKNEQFEVWFQPQYNHSTKAVIGAEALVRWRHPENGLISPGVFVPLFEKNGFIYEVDKYVWRKSCEFLKRWQNEGEALPVSVNISRYDILKGDLVDVLAGLLEEFDIPARLLRLEITESAFASAAKQLIDVVKQLKEIGFLVEIDDFGSGYSSLNTLKDVPADVVKLDMRFLEGDDNKSRGGNIIESVIRMTKRLGMSVIAEGVETIEQADYLRSVGCNYIQGYLYSKPVPMEEYYEQANNDNKEATMKTLETIETLDNNAFWNPGSIESLIFNSFVGGAVVFEFHNGIIEVLRVNDNYAKVLGGEYMTVEEAIKVRWDQHMTPKDLGELVLKIQQAIDTNKEVTDEMRLLNLQGPGTVVYIRIVMRVIARTEGSYLFYCMIEDITAQRVAEQKEMQMSIQLQAIMKNVNGGVTAVTLEEDRMVDINGVRFIYANDQYYSILGYTREQYEKEVDTPFDLVVEEDRVGVIRQTRDASIHHRPFSIIYRVIHRSGKLLWIRSSISISNFPGVSKPVQIAICNDITESRIADEKMRKNDAKLQSMNETMTQLMNDTPGGFVRIQVRENQQSQVSYVNKGFCEMLGMSYEEVMARYQNDFTGGVHPEDQERLLSSIRTLIRTQGNGTNCFRMVHWDGYYRTIMNFARVTGDDTGELYLNMYFTDITEQSKMEQQRKELLEKLPCGAAIYSIFPDGVEALYYNHRYMELMQRQPQMSNMKVINLLREEDHEILEHLLTDIRNGRDAYECNLYILHGDGTYHPFQLSCHAMNRQKDTVTVSVIFTPISAQEVAYREMLPVALQTVMSSATDLLFVKDINLNYICCSRAFAKLIGLNDESDIVGKSDSDLFDLELAEKFRMEDHTMIEQGCSLTDRIECIIPYNGNRRYSNTSKHLLKDSLGNVIGIFGTGQDITEHRENITRLRLLTDNVPGGLAMYEVSDDGIRTVYLSEGFYEMTGYAHEEYEELTKKDVFRLVYWEDRTELLGQIEEMLKSGKKLNYTCRIRLKNKESRWIDIRGDISDRDEKRILVHVVMLDITKQKDAEIRLEASHRAMMLASQIGGISFWLYDIDSRVISYDAFHNHSVLGYADKVPNIPDSIMGNGSIHPEDEPQMWELYQRLHAGVDICECTVRCMNFITGDYEWQHIVYTRLRDSKNVNQAVGFSFNADIEQENRLRYEHELVLRHELIRNSLFYYQLNLTTGRIEEYFTSLNDVEGMMDGVVVDDGLRNAILQNIAEEYRAVVEATIFRAALKKAYDRGERNTRCIYRRWIANRGWCWIQTTVTIVEKPNSFEVAAFIHAEDIDRMKKDQLAIESAMGEEIESIIVVHSKSGMAHVAQGDHTYLDFNPQDPFDYEVIWEEVIRSRVIAEEQLMCREFFSLHGMKQLLNTQDMIHLVYRVKTPGGEIRRMKTRAFYLDEHKEEIVLIRQDITELYREEQKQKEQLKEAIHIATAANHAKTEFLSHMSHDMRTPLNAVLSFSSEALTKEADEIALRENIRKIHNSGEYLLGIINDVLDMAKIEQKKTVLHPRVYTLDEFVDKLKNIMSGVSKEKGVELEMLSKVASTERAVLVDDIRFNQIFVNLLSNAVKFTPPGGKVSFIIGPSDPVDKNHVRCHFDVIDNGIGMSKEFLPHAFESFNQEYHQDYTERSNGTGLGLAIVHELVSLMHGEITVKSELGRGTAFHVILPLELVEVPDVEKHKEKDNNLEDLRGKKILLGEDNEINAEIVQMLLESIGVEVDCEDNGEKVCEKYLQVEEGYYTIVLMDIRMPIMNGLDAASKIRTSNRKDSKDIPIIALTADVFDEDEQGIQDAGMNERLSKPIQPKQFYEVLLRYI